MPCRGWAGPESRLRPRAAPGTRPRRPHAGPEALRAGRLQGLPAAQLAAHDVGIWQVPGVLADGAPRALAVHLHPAGAAPGAARQPQPPAACTGGPGWGRGHPLGTRGPSRRTHLSRRRPPLGGCGRALRQAPRRCTAPGAPRCQHSAAPAAPRGPSWRPAQRRPSLAHRSPAAGTPRRQLGRPPAPQPRGPRPRGSWPPPAARRSGSPRPAAAGAQRRLQEPGRAVGTGAAPRLPRVPQPLHPPEQLTAAAWPGGQAGSPSSVTGHSPGCRSLPLQLRASRRSGPVAVPVPKWPPGGREAAGPQPRWRHRTWASRRSQALAHSAPHVPCASTSTRPAQPEPPSAKRKPV